MKKIILSMFLILTVVFVTTSAFAETTGTMVLNADKGEYKKGEEVVIEAKITNLQSDTGIIALGAKIEYEKDKLEFVKISGAGDWGKPSYNDETGILATDRGDLGKQDEAVFQITFKVKSDSANSAKITLKNIEVSGGAGAFYFKDVSKDISIKSEGGQQPSQPDEPDKPADKPDKDTNTDKPSNNTNTEKPTDKPANKPADNPNTNSNTNTDGSKNTAKDNTSNSSNKNAIKANSAADSTAGGNLPKAGQSTVILVLIGICVVTGIVLFIKFEIITRENKH